MQSFSSGLGAAHADAGREGDRIHCSRTGGADGLDFQTAILQQLVEHTPYEGSMRPTALKSQVHAFRSMGIHVRDNLRSKSLQVPAKAPAANHEPSMRSASLRWL